MLTDLLQNVTKLGAYENYVRKTEMLDLHEMVAN